MAVELISFNLGLNWATQLYEKLQHIKKKHSKELNMINDIMFGDPLELAKYYVEPNCQETNPADRHEEDFLVSSEPIYKKIDEFLRAKFLDQPGNNQMFILSDAGMGKTSLLVMLKLLHLTSFWPKNKDCVLKAFGTKTLAEIQLIEDKMKTVLLIDALDEDSETYGQVKERLLEVLKATKNFFRVIITCRTQFFPEVEKNPFDRPGLITVSGYVCPAKYLSLFNDEKVDLYLKKRFPGNALNFENKKKIKKAKELIGQMGSLRCRPMLLSYIDKLMDSPIIRAEQNEYKIYKALVDSWLLREEAKAGAPKNELFRVCEILAKEISLRGAREISEADLDQLIDDIAELKYVKAIDIKGRSLINRNSSGNYRFSHHSIQEFLLTKHLIENPGLILGKKLPMTNLIAQMLISNSKFKACQKFFDFDNKIFKNLNIRVPEISEEDLKNTDIKGVDLKGADLRGICLDGANLKGADLQAANLQGISLKDAILDEVNLLGANLQDANLQGASFNKADLSWTDLKRALLQGARFNGADLQGAILQGANLLDVNLQGTILDKADFQGAKIDVHSLPGANLKGAVLQGLDFRGVDLKGADLDGTDLRGADLRGANFQDAGFRFTDLSWADLQDADFCRADFQGAGFEGSDLSRANLQDANLSDAKNISIEMLFTVKSLCRVKGLDPKIEAELKNKKPILFENYA
ncbi:MAG: pentapeptide repeat-containing protein [Candidatus Aminicenantes bacterium]|nr:pentapeptide repeat-containing protein [Candidatus Aminicenantes bacterium]